MYVAWPGGFSLVNLVGNSEPPNLVALGNYSSTTTMTIEGQASLRALQLCLNHGEIWDFSILGSSEID